VADTIQPPEKPDNITEKDFKDLYSGIYASLFSKYRDATGDQGGLANENQGKTLPEVFAEYKTDMEGVLERVSVPQNVKKIIMAYVDEFEPIFN